MAVKGVGQISILDLNDAILSGTEPENPVDGTLWIDSSVNPNVLKSWNEALHIWEEQTLDLGGLDPGASQDITDLKDFANKAASDGYLAETEKLNIKLLLVQMTGDTLTDRTLPTLTEIDAIKGGEVYSVRAEAIAAGTPTSAGSDYANFETAYNDLRIYLDGLDPRPWELGDTVIDPTVWPVKWDAYYERLSKLRVTTTQYQIDGPKNADGENQWQARKYTKTLASSTTIPTYADIVGLTPTAATIINDVNTNLLTPAGFSGDNFIAVFTTNVYVSLAKSISFTLASDNTASFYVDGTSLATSNNGSTVASVPLKAGWNKIELFYYEHTGGESVSISAKLSSLVDKMAYRLGSGPTLFNGVTIDTADGVVATRSDNKVKASLNATTGIKIQRRTLVTDLWSDAFYADANGVINAAGLVIDANSSLNSTPVSTVVSNAALAPGRAKTFTSTPTIPYNAGDIYKNGQTTYISTVTRTTGSYTAGDWVLAGDVTSLNTSADTSKVNNVAAATISGAVANFNNNNDRKSTTPATPTSPSLSSSINTDGSADLVLTWAFTGTGDAYDIDGFMITVYGAATNAAYTIGTTAASENVSTTTPDARAVILRGMPADEYYTVGVKAYRVVDTDINSAGIIKGSNAQNGTPLRPSSTVNLGGTNGVKVDATNGLVATTASGVNRTKTTLNATDGIKIEKSIDSGSTFPTKVFYADTNGNLNITGNITMTSGSITWTGTNRVAPPVDYIASRADNLITNGTGSLKDNTNFPDFTFDGADIPNNVMGAFKYFGKSKTITSNELVPVSTNETYQISMQVKAGTEVATPKLYAGFAPYDIDGNLIGSENYMYIAGSTTTLAQALKPGDTVVYLTSASGWSASTGTATGQRKLIFWNYSNSKGYAYPSETYSRSLSAVDLWADASLNKTNNTITLRAGWSGANIPIGTAVSQGNSSSAYFYPLASNITVPTSWQYLSGIINGTSSGGVHDDNKFPPGTSFIKMLWLANYGNSTTDTTLSVADIQLVTSVKRSDFTADKIAGMISASDDALDILSRNINLTGSVSFNTLTRWQLDQNGNKISNSDQAGYDPANPLYLDSAGKFRPLSDEATFMSNLFVDENNLTVIDGGRIKTKSVKADQITLYELVVEQKPSATAEPTGDGIKTLTISDTGNIEMAGTAKSLVYEQGKSGWIINADGSAEFNEAVFRGDIEVGYYDVAGDKYVATAGVVTAAVAGAKEVRFWAGDSRDTAAFKVYSDGSIDATRGTFEGTFSGIVQIGNITIKDDDTVAGDASFVLQDNTKVDKVVLNETLALFDVDQFTIGNDSEAGRVSIVTDNYLMQLGNEGYEFDYGNNIFEMKGWAFNGSSSTGFEFQNNTGTSPANDFSFAKGASDVKVNVKGALTTKTNLTFDTAITMKRSLDAGNKGIDFIII